MNNDSNMIIEIKKIYERQMAKLKTDWENSECRFSDEKDYKSQLRIWGNRVKQYEEMIKELEESDRCILNKLESDIQDILNENCKDKKCCDNNTWCNDCTYVEVRVKKEINSTKGLIPIGTKGRIDLGVNDVEDEILRTTFDIIIIIFDGVFLDRIMTYGEFNEHFELARIQ